MPHFVHLDDAITFLQRFHQLNTTPRSLDGSLVIGMRARGLVPCICARFAQCEHQLVLTMKRKHGMKETAWWQYRAFYQPEIIGNVLVKILGNNLQVADRYGFGSVDVVVEAGKVHVPNLFVSLAIMVQFGRIGSAAVQGMTWV